MTDGWLAVLAWTVFLIVALFSRGWRNQKVLAQALWSLIIIVIISIVAIKAMHKGNWSTVWKSFGILALFLTMVGVIPGLIIEIGGSGEKSPPIAARLVLPPMLALYYLVIYIDYTE
jgi:hypothetical protein